MELRETYFEGGKKRLYRVDPITNTEYVYYEDKREKVVIRAAVPEDAENICNAVQYMMKTIARVVGEPSNKRKKEIIEAISQSIAQYDEENPNVTLVFEKKSNRSNRFIGFGDVITDETNPAIAKMNMVFITPAAKETYKRRVCRALANMCEKYGIYEHLTLMNETGNQVEKVLYRTCK